MIPLNVMDENKNAETPSPEENGLDLINDRLYLERLSTGELLRLADHYGLDLPRDLDRVFIIEQFLEHLTDFSAVDEAETNPETDENTPLVKDEDAGADFPDQAPLPKQYNITFIEVMIRDPLWAFVFWELRAAEKEILEAAPDFGGYYLKVSSVEEESGRKTKAKTAVNFTVPVGKDDTGWYIGFPPPDENSGKGAAKLYKAELCAEKEGDELVLVTSKVFTLPALLSQKGRLSEKFAANHFASLSGINDFAIVRNGNRESRTKARIDTKEDYTG